MLITKEQQEAWVDAYVKEKHNADDCIGFIDGVNKTLEVVKNNLVQADVKCRCGKTKTNENYVTIINGGKIIIQRAEYIEDGAYIEIIGTEITLYEISQFGGEPIKIGNFTTIIEAIEHSKILT